MKLPIPKEVGGKRKGGTQTGDFSECRMTMTSGTSTGKKGLICERRETSLIGGHAIRSVQFRANMDLGSGDTSDYNSDIQNHYDSFNWDTRFESHDFQPAQSAITKTSISGSTSAPPEPLPPPTPPGGKILSSSLENINKRTHDDNFDEDKSDVDNLFRGNENQYTESKSATLAMVEDNKQPSFTANESNPTVPTPTEPSKTSTLRLSDRTRSESEDDIEKMDEPEQDGTLIGHKTLYKTTATTDNSQNSEKIDKNGNRSDLEQNEADNEKNSKDNTPTIKEENSHVIIGACLKIVRKLRCDDKSLSKSL